MADAAAPDVRLRKLELVDAAKIRRLAKDTLRAQRIDGEQALELAKRRFARNFSHFTPPVDRESAVVEPAKTTGGTSCCTCSTWTATT